MRNTLAKLKKEGKILVAVSGNPKPIGDALLEFSGLKSFFDATAYSTERLNRKPIQNRYEILQLGLQRAQKKTKTGIQPQHVLVVGDTPSDVKAAHVIGVDSLVVATGRYTLQQLREYHSTHEWGAMRKATSATLVSQRRMRKPRSKPVQRRRRKY